MMLAGCSGNNEGMQMTANASMVPIKVELSWNPEEISINDKVSFKAVVTQDGKPVDDAKEVLFEIVDTAGTTDEDNNLLLTGKPDGDGAYVAEGVLEHAGKYKVTSHVTARTQHSMPSEEFRVQP
jgi:hypothetical protein